MADYRVKEVKVPFNSKDFIAYYPQIKSSDTVTTGFLWWKKTAEVEKWKGFYKDKKDGFIFLEPYDKAELVCCNTKEEAEQEIANHIKYWEGRWEKSNRLAGIDYEKQEHVKYFPYEKK